MITNATAKYDTNSSSSRGILDNAKHAFHLYTTVHSTRQVPCNNRSTSILKIHSPSV